MLTPQQNRFAELVSEGNTYADAYREAYPVSVNWKQNAVYVQSSILMSNSNIIVRVKELQEENKKRNQVTLDEVIKELSEWLRFDPIEFFDDNNCMKNMRDLSPIARKQIADIKVQELWASADGMRVKIGEIKNIKFLDKQSTADKFMKYFGAYVTKVKIEVEDLSHLKDLLKDIQQ